MREAQAALIARITAATGADRKLDRDIALQVGWVQDIGWWWRPGGYRIADVQHFTKSMDAAMSLVPDGLALNMLYEPKAIKGQEAVVWPPGRGSPTSYAPTLPLALCLAALKARWS